MLFDSSFPRDPLPSPSTCPTAAFDKIEPLAHGITEFFASRSGGSFGKGIYRLFEVTEIPTWNDIVSHAFPGYQKRIMCFGFDWQGRVFALDAARKTEGQYEILLFEIGSGEIFQIPSNFLELHNREFIEFADDALGKSFYDEWLASGGEPPSHDECIGFEVPLFLGGEQDVENLSPTSMEVYWEISGQLLQQTADMEEGTVLGNIEIEDD